MNVFKWLVNSYLGGILMISYAIWRIIRLLKKTENPTYKEYEDVKGWLISFMFLVLGITVIIAKTIGAI